MTTAFISLKLKTAQMLFKNLLSYMQDNDGLKEAEQMWFL